MVRNIGNQANERTDGEISKDGYGGKLTWIVSVGGKLDTVERNWTKYAFSFF